MLKNHSIQGRAPVLRRKSARGNRVLMMLLFCTSFAWPQEDRILNYAVVGSASCKGGPCWNAIQRLEVQRALLAVAKAPRSRRARIGCEIAPSETKALLTELTEHQYMRITGDRYAVNFPVLSRKDEQMVTHLCKIGRAS